MVIKIEKLLFLSGEPLNTSGGEIQQKTPLPILALNEIYYGELLSSV